MTNQTPAQPVGRWGGARRTSRRPTRAVVEIVLITMITLASITAVLPSPANAASADETWVNATYQLFLGRQPTNSETSTAKQQIVINGRLAITEGLATSTEWAGVVVDGLYQDALDRNPDPVGRAWWVQQLDNGSATRDISIAIFGSVEAQNHAGTNTAYVQDLYHRILSRQPDPDGLAYWVNAMDSGTPAGAIVLGLWDSIEFRTKRVASTYQLVLGRNPDPGGRTYWAEQLLRIDEVRLAANLAASDEFYIRVTGTQPVKPVDAAIPRQVTTDHTLAVLLTLVRVADEDEVDYERSDWKHWSDLDHDGCDTRCQVKIDELRATVPGLAGEGYLSVYDNKIFTTAQTSEMDLDHVISLKQAARSGGQAWSPAVKEEFANDLGWDGSLRLVSASSNRSKGDRDPASWMPALAETDAAVGCTYLKEWLGGKYRWNLTMDPIERTTIVTMASELACHTN